MAAELEDHLTEKKFDGDRDKWLYNRLRTLAVNQQIFKEQVKKDPEVESILPNGITQRINISKEEIENLQISLDSYKPSYKAKKSVLVVGDKLHHYLCEAAALHNLMNSKSKLKTVSSLGHYIQVQIEMAVERLKLENMLKELREEEDSLNKLEDEKKPKEDEK